MWPVKSWWGRGRDVVGRRMASWWNIGGCGFLLVDRVTNWTGLIIYLCWEQTSFGNLVFHLILINRVDPILCEVGDPKGELPVCVVTHHSHICIYIYVYVYVCIYIYIYICKAWWNPQTGPGICGTLLYFLLVGAILRLPWHGVLVWWVRLGRDNCCWDDDQQMGVSENGYPKIVLEHRKMRLNIHLYKMRFNIHLHI